VNAATFYRRSQWARILILLAVAARREPVLNGMARSGSNLIKSYDLMVARSSWTAIFLDSKSAREGGMKYRANKTIVPRSRECLLFPKGLPSSRWLCVKPMVRTIRNPRCYQQIINGRWINFYNWFRNLWICLLERMHSLAIMRGYSVEFIYDSWYLPCFWGCSSSGHLGQTWYPKFNKVPQQ